MRHKLKSETTKVDLPAMETDAITSTDQERGARRPRRYITPGESRMSERFRTQPITSAERLESDRYSRDGPRQKRVYWPQVQRKRSLHVKESKKFILFTMVLCYALCYYPYKLLSTPRVSNLLYSKSHSGQCLTDYNPAGTTKSHFTL